MILLVTKRMPLLDFKLTEKAVCPLVKSICTEPGLSSLVKSAVVSLLKFLGRPTSSAKVSSKNSSEEVAVNLSKYS
jgi:hypothetical protein